MKTTTNQTYITREDFVKNYIRVYNFYDALGSKTRDEKLKEFLKKNKNEFADSIFEYRETMKDIEEFRIFAAAEDELKGSGINAIKTERANIKARDENIGFLTGVIGLVGLVILIASFVALTVGVPFLLPVLGMGLGIACFTVVPLIIIGCFTDLIPRDPDIFNTPNFVLEYDRVTATTKANEVEKKVDMLIDLEDCSPAPVVNNDSFQSVKDAQSLYPGFVTEITADDIDMQFPTDRTVNDRAFALALQRQFDAQLNGTLNDPVIAATSQASYLQK